MDKIKSRYTLAEAAEYLKRETGTPDVSVHDIVTLAAEGTLTVCFPYKGPLGLFKNGHAATPTEAEIAQSIFESALKTFYFNGILRSLSRPAPDNEITDLRGKTRKADTLHPVRVVPVCDFGSALPVELGEPEGHHWRRVHESSHLWAGKQLTAVIPDVEWLIEAESLHRLAGASTGVASARETQIQPKSVTNNSTTGPKSGEPGRRVISKNARRDTLTPVIEHAQKQCRNHTDVAEVWAVLSVSAQRKVAPLIGATEDGIQWLKDGAVEIFTRNALAGRIRRQKAR